MIKIVEELNNYSKGSIVKLKYGTFIKSPGQELIDSHHLFVVVDHENVCEISSQESKVTQKFPYNIPIEDWSSAGLRKPSHVKTDTYGKVNDKDVLELVGNLTKEDLNKVISSYNKSPHNYILEFINRKN